MELCWGDPWAATAPVAAGPLPVALLPPHAARVSAPLLALPGAGGAIEERGEGRGGDGGEDAAVAEELARLVARLGACLPDGEGVLVSGELLYDVCTLLQAVRVAARGGGRQGASWTTVPAAAMMAVVGPHMRQYLAAADCPRAAQVVEKDILFAAAAIANLAAESASAPHVSDAPYGAGHANAGAAAPDPAVMDLATAGAGSSSSCPADGEAGDGRCDRQPGGVWRMAVAHVLRLRPLPPGEVEAFGAYLARWTLAPSRAMWVLWSWEEEGGQGAGNGRAKP